LSPIYFEREAPAPFLLGTQDFKARRRDRPPSAL